MGSGNPCESAAIAFQEQCDNELCPKCNRPHFPSDVQPTLYPSPDNPNEPIGPDNQLPIYPTQYPIQPYGPQNPLQLRPQPGRPIGPQRPIEPSRPIEPQRPIQPIGPGPTQNPNQPVLNIPPATINPEQGIQWLLFGGSTDFLTGQLSGAAGTGAALLTLLGGDTPLLATPLAPIAAVVLIATAIAYSILGVIDVLAGRPKLMDTADLARFANSPSPILAAIGAAAAKGLALGIPISTSNRTEWAAIFGPGIQQAYADLQALYPNYSPRQINVLMYILLSEMGHPENHSPIFIAQLLRDEIKKGNIHIPAPTPQARTQSPNKMRVRRDRTVTSSTARMV